MTQHPDLLALGAHCPASACDDAPALGELSEELDHVEHVAAHELPHDGQDELLVAVHDVQPTHVHKHQAKGRGHRSGKGAVLG